MKKAASQNMKMGLLAVTFGLTACGGGGSSERDEILASACENGNASACGQVKNNSNVGSNGGTPSALYTTAPSAITLTAGRPATYTVGGGVAPYRVTSSNTVTVTATIQGSTLTINPVATSEPRESGGFDPTNIVVTDATGKSTAIAVTVPIRGQGMQLSVLPRLLTIGDCVTNIPFVFSGGTPPFRILTTDNEAISVTAVQQLGNDHYYLATIGPVGTWITPLVHTLTVLDSQSRAAVTEITIPAFLGHTSCPDNGPLLQAIPSSANAHVSQILTFELRGGDGTFSPPTSSNDSIASVVSQTGASFMVQARSPGTALITVASGDGQRANIRFIVMP
ncbi:hypothetical protein Q8A64_00705 [Oxalobacteraceae bacterium R-40]|uniref:BIG2 domain-containing protein n=1 Tax=Keguizhuia sedimenti TaxID=3064264 RepID=A0ABU1BIT4_9BURK|nr:hypothetical protein [Oxalobacteraceae bacterium R-40]